MTGLKSLSYAAFSVSDFDAWHDFSENIVGLQFSPRGGGCAGLRMDEYDYRLFLEEGPDDDLTAAGWELGSAADLEAYVHDLNDKGVTVRRADDALAEKRGIDALYVCDDPNGFRHEFYASRAPSSAPFVSRTLRGAGFKTGELGLGHILPVARNYQDSIAFYRDKLGLLYSDRIIQEVAPDITADAMFFHTETGRHHSLATGQFPSTKRLNHLMVEYIDMNDVGAAYDRAVTADLPIILELGHHPNDDMFSFYVRTPSGFGIELGWGGIVIDEAAWTPKVHDRMSDWGHKRRMATIA